MQKKHAFLLITVAFCSLSSCTHWWEDDDQDRAFLLEDFKETLVSENWKVGEYTNSEVDYDSYNIQFLNSGAIIANGPNTGSGSWYAWSTENGSGKIEVSFSTVNELQELNGEYDVFSFSNNQISLSKYNDGFQDLILTRP